MRCFRLLKRCFLPVFYHYFPHCDLSICYFIAYMPSNAVGAYTRYRQTDGRQTDSSNTDKATFVVYEKNAIFADMTNKNVNLKTYKEACNAIYPDCPIRNILARVSDKWSMLVLHALSQKSPMRFTELRNAIGDATPKMLSASLKTLEEDGIVCRTAYPEIPPRVEYTLTGRGQEMLEAMQPLTEWAIKNMEDILRDRAAKQKRASAKS